MLGCQAEYTFFDHTGKCYKAVWKGGGITRNDAQNDCAAEGGHLASIHDAKTNEFLTSLRKVRSYIGGLYENGQWTWTDGSAWDFYIWRAGDPKNPAVLKYAEFDYTLIGVWHNEDNIIGYDNGYICQREVIGKFIKMIVGVVPLMVLQRRKEIQMKNTQHKDIKFTSTC